MSDELMKLADEYRERTEAFDRTVCTGPIGPGGGIMPATPEERGRVMVNAEQVRRELLEKALAMGATRKEFQEAIIASRRVR